ncbi:protein of unknown function [Taphrina deformans PYCC 5710]|uniref:Uncharacterized protein n=1 Tax=Taphrina deformans (strain PYCC 5710 / ATCC 11124 / CBS 356.35 / IMI 108563 / JCM 9778 / NBRC 8474) TaxID=1097556 RepID=R4X6W9_TAPDE|nr:protein of unknown function [Taphrina deformans PYCC 5710]|eukprot:CCG80721.1 protein of unknown function [Taphrina deformans PYCC 5710]
MGILDKIRRKSTSLPSPKESVGPVPECYASRISAGVHDTCPSRRTLTHRTLTAGSARIYDGDMLVYDVEESSPHTSGTTTSVSTHGPESRFLFKSVHRPGSQFHARSKIVFFDDLEAEESGGDGLMFTSSDTHLVEPIELKFTDVYTDRSCSLLALRPDLWPTTLDIFLRIHGTGEPPVLVATFRRYRANEDEIPGFSGSPIAHEVTISGNISFALVTMFVIGYMQTFNVYMTKFAAQAATSLPGPGANLAVTSGGLGGMGGF